MANIVTGFLGGMGGCAMIGQSVINVRSGGRTRLSTFVAATFLLFLIVVLGPLVARIPMPALVAVMIMVSIGTFNWRSLRNLTSHPWQSSVVMLATVLVVVWTHDLARGVLTGVVLSGLFFAGKVKGLLTVTSQRADDRAARVYRYQGQVFFASTGRFADAIDFNDDAPAVVIDLSGAHFWDISAVDALEKTVAKLRRAGKTVEVIGLNEASATMVGKYASPAPGSH